MNLFDEGQVARKESAYLEVPPEIAGEGIANGQAELADREAPTHGLVVEDEGICVVTKRIGRLMKLLLRVRRKSLHQMMRKGTESPRSEPQQGICRPQRTDSETVSEGHLLLGYS